MKTKHLFVGGHYDGSHHWVDDGQHVVSLPVVEITSIKRAATSTPEKAAEQKIEVFRRREFRSGGRTSTAFFLDTIPPEQWMDRLIEGYNRRTQE